MRNDPLTCLEESLEAVKAQKERDNPSLSARYDVVISGLEQIIAYFDVWILNDIVIIMPGQPHPDSYRIDMGGE